MKTAIACEISRGGFSDERVFTISTHGIAHKGIASRRHMWHSDWAPIEEGEPPLDEVINGYVAARVLKVDKEHALVSIPDGDVIEVPVSRRLLEETRAS
jgi:hypothetical protein